MYECVTNNIRVCVQPVFIDEQSSPEDNRFFWAYRVTIANEGRQAVQLVSREWHVMDSLGHSIEVRGDGVIGEQPVLGPGESFEYTSGTPLSTPSGMMIGHYHMISDEGETFPVEIPAFSLDRPHEARIMH